MKRHKSGERPTAVNQKSDFVPRNYRCYRDWLRPQKYDILLRNLFSKLSIKTLAKAEHNFLGYSCAMDVHKGPSGDFPWSNMWGLSVKLQMPLCPVQSLHRLDMSVQFHATRRVRFRHLVPYWHWSMVVDWEEDSPKSFRIGCAWNN